jgi:hypothetical protein
MSDSMQRRWADLCTRLGVKPKQFATLLAVTAVAVGALGVKGALKPSKARAATAAAAPAKSSDAGAPAAEPAARAERGAVVELVLESRPARDPFRPFFLAADAAPEHAAPGQPAAPVVAAAAPAPTGLSLRAIIAGEYAVIGEQTVGVGDEVTDGEGRRFTVEAIHERRVVLREGGRRTELGYALPGAARGAAKGVRK